MSEVQKKVQTISGTISRISDVSTVHVSTKVTKMHPIYRKRYTLTRSYTAHNPGMTVKVGDPVTIKACRPISKTKSWVIAE